MLSFDEIKRRCAPVFDSSPIVERAYVFGSYARGEQDEESDVDICYDKPDASVSGMPHGWAMFDEHARLRNALESALGLPVDLLPLPDEHAGNSRAQRRFAREVNRCKRGIYERS